MSGIKNKKLSIEVWDNGPGIAEDKQEKIFEEFERLEQNREIPGLGLGLAISERIANLLNLKISLYSVPGKGTGFKIEVPISQTENLPELKRETNEQYNGNSNDEFTQQTVLVIDNDVLMLKAIASQLRDWGFHVVTGTSLATVQESLSKDSNEPAFIIADYHLDNDENGVDLVSSLLKQKQWSLACIICSADPSERVRQHTSDANFLFLRKPVKALALKRVIRQIVAEK